MNFSDTKNYLYLHHDPDPDLDPMHLMQGGIQEQLNFVDTFRTGITVKFFNKCCNVNSPFKGTVAPDFVGPFLACKVRSVR